MSASAPSSRDVNKGSCASDNRALSKGSANSDTTIAPRRSIIFHGDENHTTAVHNPDRSRMTSFGTASSPLTGNSLYNQSRNPVSSIGKGVGDVFFGEAVECTPVKRRWQRSPESRPGSHSVVAQEACPASVPGTPMERTPCPKLPYASPVAPNINLAASFRCPSSSASSPTGQSTRTRSLELVLLHAQPLEISQKFDSHKELNMVFEELKHSGIQLKVGLATSESLTQCLARTRHGKHIVLYLVAHTKTDGDRVGLVLESLEERGGTTEHVLWPEHFNELMRAHDKEELCSMFLIFLNTCNSEPIAKVLHELGCRHVIGVSGKVLDKAAHQFAKSLFRRLAHGKAVHEAFNMAKSHQRAHSDPEIVATADMFVLLGEDAADIDSVGPSSFCMDLNSVLLRPGDEFEDASTYQSVTVPPQTKNFVGRSDDLRCLAHVFGRHRVCVVYGAKGIGKWTLGLEFARFGIAPGRAFSCGVVVVDTNAAGVESLTRAIKLEICQLEEQHVPRSPSGEQFPQIPQMPSAVADDQREQVIAILKQLESRRRYRLLLVIRDRQGIVNSCGQVRALLGDIVDKTDRSHVLICSSEPVRHVLPGQRGEKFINCELKGLSSQDAAKLLLKHCSRLLEPRDFPVAVGVSGAAARINAICTRNIEVIRTELEKHPIMRKLGGNPASIFKVAVEQIVPGGQTLIQIAESLEGQHS